MFLKRQKTFYTDIIPYLQTGDIVLLHGVHLSSKAIEMLEDSPWSHVGMIVLAEDIGLDCGDDNILFWESDTPTPPKDVIYNKSKSGPMLVKFSERLKYNFTHHEHTRCAIRHLNTQRDKKFKEAFKNLIPKIHDATFPDSIHEFLNPTIGRVVHKKTSLDTMFCSELAAFTYMELGLITSRNPVNSYLPLDFSEKLSLSLLKRASLGNEIEIDVNIIEGTIH